MLVLEAKLVGKSEQFMTIDEAIRVAQFVRNKALRYWMDGRKASKFDLNKLCAVLAKKFEWCKRLNSMARQASAERAWSAIKRFYDNCKDHRIKKKGYPRFKKNCRSVEYKTSGWHLKGCKSLTLTDGFNAGTFKLLGTRDLNFYSKDLIKRLRVVRRADGYYAQFCVAEERDVEFDSTGQSIGLDVGLHHFYTDSNGSTVDNPRYLRKSEKLLQRRQRQVSKKFKKGANQSNRYKKAKNLLARKHLKVSRQRKDFAVKLARCVIRSNDLVVLEDLRVSNLVRNRKLAKSISDASWSLFRQWLEYFGQAPNKQVIAVAPQWTSQKCSCCGEIVVKSLSTRTHKCPGCTCILDRDHNAAINLLNTQGHWEINAWGDATSTPLSANLMQQVASRNQESALL